MKVLTREQVLLRQLQAQALATIRHQASHWPASMLREAARYVAGQPARDTQLTTFCDGWRTTYGVAILTGALETCAELRALAERNCLRALRARVSDLEYPPPTLEDIETAGLLVAEALDGLGDASAAWRAADDAGVSDLIRQYGGYVVQQAAQDLATEWERRQDYAG